MKLFVVDTASPAITYHPKIFGIKSEKQICLLVGSANLTTGGLYRNIEASFLYQDEVTKESLELWGKYKSSLKFLQDTCSENVFCINSFRTAYDLFLDGLLVDERISYKPNTSGHKKRNTKEYRTKINLNSKETDTLTPRKKKASRVIKREIERNKMALLWEIYPLTERDLNIPRSSKTHLTGDINFKKGLLKDIDQRHYFRDQIFNELDWKQDKQHPHLERATTSFEIIIKGVDFGNYDLEITHNTDTYSETYRQKNCMTKLKWGKARTIIAKRELLECTLRMYKPQNIENNFILEFS
jgi:hypothetical protein